MPHCVICVQDVDRWLPHPHREQRSAFMQSMQTVGSDLAVYQCPACGCADRDQDLWLYLQAAGVLQAVAGARVLHLAPEPVLERLIAALGPARYVRGDLHPTRAGHLKLDVENLPFAEGEFHLVICNRAAGFDGQLLQHDAVLPSVSAADWGCNAQEPLLAFWKPGPPAAHSAAGVAA